jgi:DNA-binding response OmpR family regulator
MDAEPHILVADDDDGIRELVQLILHSAGFRVTTTGQAADVLKLVAKIRLDVVLLDYWMPTITGLELCRRIRIIDQNTPILICSGVFDQADREAAALAGAQGYLAKPFNADRLIRAVRSVLN